VALSGISCAMFGGVGIWVESKESPELEGHVFGVYVEVVVGCSIVGSQCW